jgi:transcriptional regulator with XRE-family HTH domain
LAHPAAIVMLLRMDDDDWLRAAFGEILKELREERGFSQAQLALEAELDQSFLSLIERGDRQPSLLSLFAICDALKVEPDDVVRRLSRMRHSDQDS